MTPLGIGRIEWLCEGGELKRGWGHMGYAIPSGVITGATAGQFTDVYAAGEVGIIWLDYYYPHLDQAFKANVKTNKSASGVTQSLHLSVDDLFDFGQDEVTDIRTAGLASDFSGFQSFMRFAVKKKHFVWWPDYENYPGEYYSCVLETYAPPKRVGTQAKFNFRFKVRVLPAVQYPSTVPSFV